MSTPHRAPDGDGTPPGADASAGPGSGLKPADLTGARILVVDEKLATVALTSRILRLAGFRRVWGMTDPTAALDAVREWDPHLVVFDLHMPGGGIDFLRTLRTQHHPMAFMPILVVTADTSPGAMIGALGAGANDFITKPVDGDEVVLRVRNLVALRLFHDELVRHNAELATQLRQHTQRDRQRAADVDRIRDEIRGVITDGAPRMVFQPIVELASGIPIGYEALSRFPDEFRSKPPEQWFAEAHEVGLAIELELAAVANALPRLAEISGERFCAVNLSPEAMLSPACVTQLADFDLGRVVIEVTEHDPIDDYPSLSTAISQLRRTGVRVAVDDAGAGFASLRHILKLAPEFIKLDMALVRNVDSDPIKRALTAALLRFAAEVDARIIAEGIETEAELQTLSELGVGHGQGFHIARPAPLEQVIEFAGRPQCT